MSAWDIISVKELAEREIKNSYVMKITQHNRPNMMVEVKEIRIFKDNVAEVEDTDGDVQITDADCPFVYVNNSEITSDNGKINIPNPMLIERY